jgi:hypothetical protein
LPCALYKTHGKEALCRAPERKRTAKIFTHGKLGFSRSEHTLTRNTSLICNSASTNLSRRCCRVAALASAAFGARR